MTTWSLHRPVRSRQSEGADCGRLAWSTSNYGSSSSSASSVHRRSAAIHHTAARLRAWRRPALLAPPAQAAQDVTQAAPDICSPGPSPGPKNGSSPGPSPGPKNGSSPGPSPLQCCLAQHGFSDEDLAAFNKPQHQALTQQAVDSDVRPKLAALAAQGLTPQEVAALFSQDTALLGSSYSRDFQPTMQHLGHLLEGVVLPKPDKAGRKGSGSLTALAILALRQPAVLAGLLASGPAPLIQLQYWACVELGVPLEELGQAVLRDPSILCMPLGKAKAMASHLVGELGMAREEVGRQLVRGPRIFGSTPEELRAMAGEVRAKLGIEDEGWTRAVMDICPQLILEWLPEVERVLRQLQSLHSARSDAELAGLLAPKTAAVPVGRLMDNILALQGMGLSQDDIRSNIYKKPGLMA